MLLVADPMNKPWSYPEKIFKKHPKFLDFVLSPFFVFPLEYSYNNFYLQTHVVKKFEKPLGSVVIFSGCSPRSLV
jgi:hypothetical protein